MVTRLILIQELLVRIQLELPKEGPKGVVSRLENGEGVTAVGVQVRHLPHMVTVV